MNENNVLDVAVIGAGPAGLTAGLYAARAGLSVAIYERISPGGQLAQTERVENYPGFAEGADGFELAWAMKEQAEHFGAIIVSEEVTAVDFSGEVKTLTTPFGQHKARSVIVATGARPRKMGLAGEERLAGRGVSYCATCDGNFFRGKSVCVLGGGNTAAADAKYLARICERVYLVHRRDTLRASAIDRERLSSLPNVEFVWNSRIADLHSEEGRLVAVEVEDVATVRGGRFLSKVCSLLSERFPTPISSRACFLLTRAATSWPTSRALRACPACSRRAMCARRACVRW